MAIRYKEFEDADDFLDNADCANLTPKAKSLLEEIEENDLMEVFGQFMFRNAGDYADVDGYDYSEMIHAFCRTKEITNV